MPSLATLQSVLNGIGAHVDAARWIAIFALVLARVVTAVTLAPFLGGTSVPNNVKVGVGAIISLVLLAPLGLTSAAQPPAFLLFAALLVKEVLIGAVIGYFAQLVFYAVQMAGTIIDTQSGLNQIAFLAPQLPGHVSALGNLQFQASLVLFFALRGHLFFIDAIARSFRQLPVLEVPHLSPGVIPLAEQAARLTADALLTACQLAAPVVLAIFLTDVAFGVVGRVASQVRIGNESYTAKALIALALVFLLVPAFFGQLRGIFSETLRGIESFLSTLR
jgi:flagellar biosynthesis protein FliR